MKNKSFRSPLKIESEKTGEEKMATNTGNESRAKEFMKSFKN